MQAYKSKGKIDHKGHLIITEPIDLAPGDVEVIILQSVENIADDNNPKTDSQFETIKTGVQCQTKILRDWFANTQPVSPDFNPDQARWEALQEKYL